MGDEVVVRVLPDVPAIDRCFDYVVPESLHGQVGLGDVVRIPLHGRRVRGWVVGVDVEPPEDVALRPLARRSGLGPTPDLIELAGWAAWRWAGRRASLLRTATPPRNVVGLPARPGAPALPPTGPLTAAALDHGASVLRLPPTADLGNVALAAAARGPALVLCPTQALVDRVAARLRAAGAPVAVHPDGWARGAAGATVVGTRAAAWAPVGGLSAVVVLDEHDEAHQQEQTPTWHARDVAIERARRAGVPCVATSPCPSLEALGWGRLFVPDRARERAGWPAVEVVDRREDEPGRRTSLISDPLVRLLRSDGRVVCVLNRTGRARLLACRSCEELARCAACDAAVEQPGDDLRCRRCGTTRPPVCLQCGAGTFKNLRVGVARLREELEALLREPVGEVTAASDDLPDSRVLVGTEAVLQRLDVADACALLDLDQELLAPRLRAAEQALALVARAARLVGASGPPRGGRAAGRLLLQTRLPDHEVVQAALRGDPTPVADAERARREQLGFPPFAALAEVSGEAAPAFVERLGAPLGLQVAEVDAGRWLLRAPDHQTLCDALAAVERPPGRLRVAVDPLRV